MNEWAWYNQWYEMQFCRNFANFLPLIECSFSWFSTENTIKDFQSANDPIITFISSDEMHISSKLFQFSRQLIAANMEFSNCYVR